MGSEMKEKVKLHQTRDAWVWAKEFVRVVRENKLTIDESLMHTWFANAIMVGYDEGRRQEKARLEAEAKASPSASEDRIRVLRVLEYEGPRSVVEHTLANNAVKKEQRWGKAVIREAILGQVFEVVGKEGPKWPNHKCSPNDVDEVHCRVCGADCSEGLEEPKAPVPGFRSVSTGERRYPVEGELYLFHGEGTKSAVPVVCDYRPDEGDRWTDTPDQYEIFKVVKEGEDG